MARLWVVQDVLDAINSKHVALAAVVSQRLQPRQAHQPDALRNRPAGNYQDSIKSNVLSYCGVQ